MFLHEKCSLFECKVGEWHAKALPLAKLIPDVVLKGHRS